MDPKLSSPEVAEAERQMLEFALERVLSRVVHDFLEGVIDDAMEALGATVLLAAGRRRNPFAFTNVMKRWRDGIARMAGMLSHVRVRPYRVREILEASDLPSAAYEEVVEILRAAQEEGASDLAVRRRLSAVLIPRESDGWDTRSKYRVAVSRIARDLAAQNFNENRLEDLRAEGATTKKWAALDDDRTRPSHAEADGQVVGIEEAFTVGGHPVLYPGDPFAPYSEVANCRCVVLAEDESRTASGAKEEGDMSTESKRLAWSGVIGMENTMTGDGRLIENEALRWSDLPIPFRHAPADIGGHDGAVVVGAIETISREKGGRISGTGYFDLDSEVGREAARQAQEGLTVGVSMDLDDISFEVRVAEELLSDVSLDGDPEEGGEARTVVDGKVVMMQVSSDDEIMVTTSGRIRAATLVAIPAFAEARIEVSEEAEVSGESLAASAGPARPHRSWFSDPELQEPTAITVTEDGRVYGHLATWDTCHIAHEDFCTQPPRSNADYDYFHVGAVLTDDGEISSGVITLNTTHAGAKASAMATLAHYENTGLAAADVRAGEDMFGIWVAGAVRPNVSEDDVRALRGAPLSGDWRRIQGNLELVAALAVNVPGFPVPRPKGLVASGQMRSLVASGMVPPKKVRKPGTEGALTAEDLRYLKSLARREKRVQADAMAARLREEKKAKVEAMASMIEEVKA